MLPQTRIVADPPFRIASNTSGTGLHDPLASEREMGSAYCTSQLGDALRTKIVSFNA